MRQSNAALPHEITELKTALTIKLFCLLYTKNIAAEHIPADIVENTEKSSYSLCIYNYLHFKHIFIEKIITQEEFSTKTIHTKYGENITRYCSCYCD